MQKLIKNGELASDTWALANEDFTAEQLGDNNVIVPLQNYLDLSKDNLDLSKVGVSLASDDDALALKPHLEDLQLVAIQFTNFADGRSFSQARVLREQLDYNGEIRAIGAYMQDQLYFLSRCGVNAFLLPEETKADSALESLKDFSDSYQAGCDEPQPLFRRRV